MKKVSDFILLLELVLLSVPLTILLLAIGAPIAFKQLLELFSSDTVIIALLALLSAYAMVCIWWLVISYIRNDPILSKKYYLYWSGVIVGILISIGALLSGYLF